MIIQSLESPQSDLLSNGSNSTKTGAHMFLHGIATFFHQTEPYNSMCFSLKLLHKQCTVMSVIMSQLTEENLIRIYSS